MKILNSSFSILFCLLFIYLSFSVNVLAQQVDVKVISPEKLVKVVNRTGKLEFKRTLNLSFKTAGYLAKLNIDEGDSFVKGQVLAELDTFELIAEKNASYARLLQAKNDVTRVKALLAKKLSSRQALDNAKTLVETTRASHKLTQYNLEKAQLIAPFDGVVLTRLSELAELQNPNQAALQIAAINNNLVVRVELTAEEVGLVKYNQDVQMSFSIGRITGKVSKVPVLNNPLSQLYTIEVLLTDVNINEVTIGQVVKVNINIASNSYVYRLPIAALNGVNEQGQALITLKSNKKSNKGNYQQQAFIIDKLSNNFIYLSSTPSALPLNVVVQGWQQLAHLKKEQIKLNPESVK